MGECAGERPQMLVAIPFVNVLIEQLSHPRQQPLPVQITTTRR